MKKFYFLAAAAAVALSTSAAVNTVKVSSNVAGLQPLTAENTAKTISLKDVAGQQAPAQASIKADGDEAEETFKSIGTGTWVEGPLDCFTDVKSGVTHELEIFQSESNPNVYRMVPYGEGSELATMMGKANTNFFYLDVTDPEKVLGSGDGNNGFFTPFSGFTVAQYVPEVGWPNTANGYGSYDKDANTVSFPAGSFAIYYNNGWSLTNVDGKFTIYLPGADVKDYSFSTDADVCNNNNIIRFMATAGADVTAVKSMILKGSYQGTQANFNIVAQSGSVINSGSIYTFTDEETGVYTIFLVAVGEDGTALDGFVHYCHILDNDADNWTLLGAGTWTDGILQGAGYLTETFDAEVEVEQNVADPNLLRFVIPYASFFPNYAVSHDDHNHYIYLDVTDPDNVKVDLSLTGIDISGHMSVWSANARYSANTAEQLQSYGYGIPTYDAETRTISFPAKSLFTSEPYYSYGAYFTCGTESKLALPEVATTPDALFIAGDAKSAPVEMTKTDNVFKATNVTFVAAEGSDVCSFYFVDNATAATKYFGATEANQTVVTGNDYEFVAADEAGVNKWSIEAGVYDITVDFDKNLITVVSGAGSVMGEFADDANVEVEYYNLQGVRVAQPAAGLYIARQGNKVTKVTVK